MKLGSDYYRNGDIALRVAHRQERILEKIGKENIFPLTRKMLEDKTDEYKFIIYDEDQWVATNSHEVLQIRSDGHIYKQTKKIIDL